jgi:signal transduction histidine kinase
MATFESCVATAEWQMTMQEELLRLRVFGDAPASELACLIGGATEIAYDEGAMIADEREPLHVFMVLLEGRARVSRKDGRGQYFFNKTIAAPAFMGEVPIMSNAPLLATVKTESHVRGLLLDEQSFWDMMSRCPTIRQIIRAEMAVRLSGAHQQQNQQEKMVMLGTMTAGLMHELNNPGAAARRAASQLRSNLQRMHALARGFSERGHTPEQRTCLSALQERALSVRSESCMSSLQQSDAEEELGTWMDDHAIGKAWEFAPVLVSSGISVSDLDCLAKVFANNEISEPIEWLEATASSMQMVGLVEDSVARVTELAAAVKSYVHEGTGGVQDVDVNESIHATMVMLKHKFREKNIRVQKDFGAGIPKLHCLCSGLNQVWTNLLDNALDAVPEGGTISVRTALAGDEVQISIQDNGAGIPTEVQEHIFDPFFTTKPVGVGSGLGLGIVRKVLEGYDGRLTLQSEPGRTEFVVHVPTDQTVCRVLQP